MAEETLKNKTARGLFWGGISSGIQQLLSLGFGIFLSRILSPSDYGIVGMLAIFTGVGMTLQESGFIAALTNRKNITHDDYNAVFWFNVFVGVVLYVILFLGAPLIVSFFNEPRLLWVSRIVFLNFLFGSLGTVQFAYLFKNIMARERAKIDIYSLILSNSAALIMALNGMAYWGIAIQSVLYIGLGTFFRWYFSPWRPTFSFNIQPLKEMFPFSIKLLFTGLLGQVTANIFSLLLGKYYSVQQVGYFAQGNKWMNMGAGLISGTLTGVAQPIFVQAEIDKRQVAVFHKMIRFTALISFPVMFGLMLISRELILITITEKWLASVAILQTLCVWGAFYPICELYKNVIVSCGKSNIYLNINVVFGSMQLLLLVVMLPFGISWMVISYVIAYFFYLFMWHYFASQLIEIQLFSVLKDILPYLIITGFSLSGGYLVANFMENVCLRFLLKIFVSSILYVTIIWLSGSVIFKESISFLLKKNNFIQ